MISQINNHGCSKNGGWCGVEWKPPIFVSVGIKASPFEGILFIFNKHFNHSHFISTSAASNWLHPPIGNAYATALLTTHTNANAYL